MGLLHADGTRWALATEHLLATAQYQQVRLRAGQYRDAYVHMSALNTADSNMCRSTSTTRTGIRVQMQPHTLVRYI